jgi:acyl carrier protein
MVLNDRTEKIINFLIDEKKLTPEEALSINMDADLIEMGIIDSMGILELLVFMEQEFAIDLENASITAENMRSLSSMIEFLDSMQK